MKKVSPGEKELITPAEAIEYYTLSWRKEYQEQFYS